MTIWKDPKHRVKDNITVEHEELHMHRSAHMAALNADIQWIVFTEDNDFISLVESVSFRGSFMHKVPQSIHNHIHIHNINVHLPPNHQVRLLTSHKVLNALTIGPCPS